MRKAGEHVGLWAFRPKTCRSEGRPGGYPQVRTRGLAAEDEEASNTEVMGRRADWCGGEVCYVEEVSK